MCFPGSERGGSNLVRYAAKGAPGTWVPNTPPPMGNLEPIGQTFAYPLKGAVATLLA